jgi:hypothetical protein
MRLRPSITQACGLGLCLAALAAMPNASLAQEFVAPVVPIVSSVPSPIGHGWGFWHKHPAFPRTFSYQYDVWFNRPHHARYVGPDGCVYWGTTVRGLPLGAPWPGP